MPFTEVDAIRARYALRPPRPADEAIHRERNQAVERLLRRTTSNRKTARVLDAGCGSGAVLELLLQLGFESHHLTGIDLLAGRIAAARRRLPAAVALVCGEITEFEWQDFDLVLAFTLFSSVLESSNRKMLAGVLWAALKPGGALLLYDMRWHNPRNPGVRPMRQNDIAALFPGAQSEAETLTLAPPLARVAGTGFAYNLLNRMSFLRSHLLHCVRKPGP